jgi:hypothetical protein
MGRLVYVREVRIFQDLCEGIDIEEGCRTARQNLVSLSPEVVPVAATLAAAEWAKVASPAALAVATEAEVPAPAWEAADDRSTSLTFVDPTLPLFPI